MASEVLAYSRNRILQFLGMFWIGAVVCYMTVLLNGSAVPTKMATPFGLYACIIGLAAALPLALWFDTAVHNKYTRLGFYLLMWIETGGLYMFFLGSYNPMEVLWLILCVITYIEYGTKSFWLSSAYLTVLTGYFCVVVRPLLPEGYPFLPYVIYSFAFTFALIITGFVITQIIASANRRRIELEKTRESELEQLNKVSALLNSISEAIITMDNDTRITSQNAAALAFFDTNESLVGRKLTDMLKIVDGDEGPINVSKMLSDVTRSVFRDDVMVKSEETGDMRLSLQMSPIYSSNRRQGSVMVISDITKQKTLEAEKDEFISVASHELRTPIAVAEAALSNLVMMQQKGMDPAQLTNTAQMAHDEIIYLAGVVNDLSTLSRAERGVADRPEPIDLKLLFHDLYSRYEPDATKKSLRLELDLGSNLPIVTVSRLYLEEMIQNLITNAIKYTQKGSVTLHAEKTDEGVLCAVIDTGIGMSKSDQKHIFERFWRSEDYRTRETNGTGLGLYVVSKLAAKVGTKVVLKSRLNHGSSFSMIIPLKSETQSTGKRSTVSEA